MAVVSCSGDDDNGLSRAGVDSPTEAQAEVTVNLPEREAPFGVAGLDLPDDVSEVVAVMSRLPDSINGLERAQPLHGEGDVRIVYRNAASSGSEAPPITFRAINLASPEGSYPPDWMAGQVIARSSVSGEDVLEFGVDGELAWAHMTQTTSDTDSPATSEQRTMLFGETSGQWVYSVQAEGDDLLGVAMSTLTDAIAAES